MPVFEYKGLTEAGKAIRGVKDADTAKTLRALLRKEGVFLTEVVSEKEAGAAAAKGREVNVKKLFASRVSSTDLAIMTRQLAVLIGAGVALVEALTALQEQVEHERLKLIVSQVKTRVNEGSSLADAMAQHPKVFSTLYVNMIRAGESSGALDVVLVRLADFTESQARLKSKIVGTLTYPIIMIVEDNQLTLPFTTRTLIGLSSFARNYWWLLIALSALFIWLFLQWKKTESGRTRWDRLTLTLPVFGSLIRMIAIARFSRTLATLLKSGVPLLSAMDIVRNIVDNKVLSGIIESSRDSIREGESIAAPLKRSGEFPPLVYHMIAIGERSGQLEEMLVNVANAYETQVDVRIAALTSLLEPVMIVTMGGGVAFVVFSILMPILQLNTMVHG
jgi:general secretion pathway protein F